MLIADSAVTVDCFGGCGQGGKGGPGDWASASQETLLGGIVAVGGAE